MARLLYHDFQRFCRRMNWFPLAFFFVLGLFSGGYLFLRADDSLTSLMGRALSCRVSIVSLASVLFLPFLFSAFAVYVSRPGLFRLIAYCKALSLSYVSLGVLEAFGHGGWLALPLLMFSDLCALPLLWLYWLRHLEPGPRGNGNLRFAIWLLFAGSVDYFIVSPFVASL